MSEHVSHGEYVKKSSVEFIQDGGGSSLTDCTAMLSQFIAVIPYSFWHFQLCLSHMAAFFFFFFILHLPHHPPLLFLSLSLLPILFLHLYSISFLSGRSLIALCVGSFHMWGSGSPGILLLLCSVVDGVSGVQRGERGTEQPRSRKDAVRYVKDSCSIYLLILRGTSQARCTKIGSLVFFGWLHPSYHSSTWKW